ncbi:signal peptide-containing [Cordyceps militaris]|uniref:Signal peptide-containing n=1 Tax=Cordyceps militaris TaxID=73501 RepID=A0A2H4SN54_CORMI|nr:signal peptide-containing [Cordyceps militaris]
MAAPVSTPKISPLPETDDSKSVILEPYHVDLLPEYGYISREYLISGVAYGEPYCTRLLLRCPEDVSRFTGFVVVEPSHLWGGTSIWRHTNRWLMRNGHAWLEVDSQATSAVGKIKNADPQRYRDICFIPGPTSDEFAANIPFVTDVTKESLSEAYMKFKATWWPATLQSPEILTAASHALRAGDLGLVARRVVLSGLSQTGGVTRRFVTHSAHLRLPDGSLPFEGFLPCQSGGEALPDVPGAKIIELVGEAEFQSVRLPCGISGQMLGVSHRRPDSDAFRLYEVACMAHRESRWASPAEQKKWSVADLRGAQWSTFSNSFIYHAVFEAMEKWTRDAGICPPPGSIIDTMGDSDDIVRDEHGNAVGGVRTMHSDAPLASFVAATPKGRPSWYWGSQCTFSAEKLQMLYGTVANYRHIAGRALQEQIQRGFLLPMDAEVLRRETIEAVEF